MYQATFFKYFQNNTRSHIRRRSRNFLTNIHSYIIPSYLSDFHIRKRTSRKLNSFARFILNIIQFWSLFHIHIYISKTKSYIWTRQCRRPYLLLLHIYHNHINNQKKRPCSLAGVRGTKSVIRGRIVTVDGDLSISCIYLP